MLTMVHIETALFLFSYGYSWAVTKYDVMISEYSVKLMGKKNDTKTNKKTKIWLERIVCKIIFLPVFANYRAVCDVKAWVKELMNVGDKIDVFWCVYFSYMLVYVHLLKWGIWAVCVSVCIGGVGGGLGG